MRNGCVVRVCVCLICLHHLSFFNENVCSTNEETRKRTTMPFRSSRSSIRHEWDKILFLFFYEYLIVDRPVTRLFFETFSLTINETHTSWRTSQHSRRFWTWMRLIETMTSCEIRWYFLSFIWWTISVIGNDSPRRINVFDFNGLMIQRKTYGIWWMEIVNILHFIDTSSDAYRL